MKTPAALAPSAPGILWVDITTLAHWTRPVVGIARVEQQLCQYLLDHVADNLRFCRYDKAADRIIEVPHADARAHLERIAAYGTPAATPAGIPPLVPTQSRLVRLALHGLNYLPAPLRPHTLRILRALWPRVRPILHRVRQAQLRRRVRRQPAAVREMPPPPPSAVPFDANSLYLSVGLDWDHKHMAQLYRHTKARGARCLYMCYDIIPVLFPQLYAQDVSGRFAHYFADLAWGADAVVCISEATRNDLRQLLETLGVPVPPLHVVHLGSDILPKGGGEVSADIRRLAASPFILFVSTIERRKNHEIIYRAYTRLVAEGVALPQVVFVGMAGWGVADLQSDLALDPRTQGHFTQLNHIGDAELAYLYRHALFTVYPSLYEGWGLPVAESLAFGKFCLTSNTSSLPEVGGEFVHALDPWDLPAWVDALRYYIAHPEEVARRNADIAARYRPVSWTATARAIHDHARTLLAAPARRP